MSSVAVLSDIHGNAPALRAVIDDVVSQGCVASYVLGDIINGVDPQGVFDLLGELPGLCCIKGNAEQYLVTPGLERIGNLYPQPGVAEVAELLIWIRQSLSDAAIATIERMPSFLAEGRRWYVHDTVHDRLRLDGWEIAGVLPEHQEFMHHSPGFDPDATDGDGERLFQVMHHHGIDELYMGHTHVPFVLETQDCLVCNPGSVGMPLDGDWRASWLLLESDHDVETPGSPRRAASIRRVRYDLEAALERVDEVRSEYPSFRTRADVERYKQRLRRGVFA